MSIWTQKSALIQLRTSPLKFDDLAEKSEKSSVSNLSTKALAARHGSGGAGRPVSPSRLRAGRGWAAAAR